MRGESCVTGMLVLVVENELRLPTRLHAAWKRLLADSSRP